MRQLLIEPRDSLLFRDAREFGDAQGRARSVEFPLPSVLAGAIRTRRAYLNNQKFTDECVSELLQISVISPFLVELSDDGNVADWLFPAPRDAVIFDENLVRPLFPRSVPNGCATDLDRELSPLAFDEFEIREKPAAGAAAFWSYRRVLESWLINPKKQTLPENYGLSSLPREERTHVKIGALGTAEDKHLFSTQMLRFTACGERLDCPRRLALLALVSDDKTPLNGLFPLGGERRLAHWRTEPPQVPTCPVPVRQAITRTRKARILLATPAYFLDGTGLPELSDGCKLEGAAIRGYVTASGWDLQAKKPKPSRRLAPSGTTYFVSLPDNWDDAQVSKWIDTIWMQSISDDEQSRRDGFGVALLGSWSREMTPLGGTHS